MTLLPLLSQFCNCHAEQEKKLSGFSGCKVDAAGYYVTEETIETYFSLQVRFDCGNWRYRYSTKTTESVLGGTKFESSTRNLIALKVKLDVPFRFFTFQIADNLQRYLIFLIVRHMWLLKVWHCHHVGTRQSRVFTK